MKNRKILKSVIAIFILVGLIGCNKNDDDNPVTDLFHPNGIKKLNSNPITVIESTYTFGETPERTVNTIEMSNLDGDDVIILNSNEQIILSTNDDNLPDGETIILIVNSTELYTGSNFTVNENNNSITLSGQVTNTSSDIKSLSITLQESHFGAGNSSYTINENQALLSGTLGTYTFNQILEINSNYPEVNTFVLTTIEGSVNDDVNVETGRLIRNAGYSTHLKANSEIYSGGVDLFCSGKIRTREAGSKIGVHSWCCYEGQTADQLPQNSPGHNSQLAYFKEMLGTTNGPNFYFFTINAAPFNGIHLMTDTELEQYQLITN
ncbi:hypothetical protein [uncultured Lacinutrix sp.]|uniref:hypothetical protein n=1 Tax=uncultured Lacinutrix sp. TaxID=574032 RepID=UPI00262C26EE|nr:hypothetical protein [uncultured Lacinutrix sp.]